MALQKPERVRKIALYAAWVYQEQIPPFLSFAVGPWIGESVFSMWFQQRTRYRLALAFHDMRYVTRGLVNDVEQMLALPGSAAGALAAMRSMDFAAQQRRYARLEKPALLLWGRDDSVTPPKVAERLARDLRADVRIYPDCGHFPMIEAARASNRDLAAFLAEP
jgi:pimeloyl-ACP methyl ester carboxylesterase